MPSNKGVGKRTEKSASAAKAAPGGKNTGSTKGLGKRTEKSMRDAMATPGGKNAGSLHGVGKRYDSQALYDAANHS